MTTDFNLTAFLDDGGRWLAVHYECPACEHEWTEGWSCACDSECPSCGLGDIEAKDWAEDCRAVAEHLGVEELPTLDHDRAVARLPPGTLVHVLHQNAGTDQYDEEVTLPAGSIAEVLGHRWIGGKQGWGVDLGYPNGVVGTWDEADPEDTRFAFALVADPELRAEAEAAFAAFAASGEPTPPFPTPLLDALIGPITKERP